MESWTERHKETHERECALQIAQRAIEHAAKKDKWWEEFNRRQNDPQPETD